MDEDRLAAALRGATDDVQVPRDLVRRAERAGRARRSRRRSAATALAVGVVVLAGGALVVPQIGSGDSDSASSTAGGASGASSAAGSSASPAPPLADPAPRSAQDSAPEARAGSPAAESAACDPAMVVDGVRVREGDAAPVVAGAAVEIAAAPLCGPVPPGGRYTVVLVPRGSQTPTALGDVVPADDGSLTTTVTLPASTPPGLARLSVTGSDAASACLDAGCTGADSAAEVDVLPAEPTRQRSAPSPEESP